MTRWEEEKEENKDRRGEREKWQGSDRCSERALSGNRFRLAGNSNVLVDNAYGSVEMWN